MQRVWALAAVAPHTTGVWVWTASIVILVLHTVLSGTYLTASAVLGQALFAKLKFGQHVSAAGMTTSLGGISPGAFLGPILELSGKDYGLSLLISLIFCLVVIAFLCVVDHRFLQLGGPMRYRFPE